MRRCTFRFVDSTQMDGSGLPSTHLPESFPAGVVAAVVLPRRLRYLVGVLGQVLASQPLSMDFEESLRGGRAIPVTVDGVFNGAGADASFFEAFLRGGKP